MYRKEVIWLPSDPAISGPSMVRYWAYLHQEAMKQNSWRIRALLGLPPKVTDGPPESRFNSRFRKYLGYPVKVRLSPVKGAVYHLLDHSWANLIPWIPRGCPVVATIHDLIPFRSPEGLSSSQLKRWKATVQQLRKADAFMADSTHTKRESTELLGLDPDKITVVPLGVDSSLLSGMKPTACMAQAVASLRQNGVELIVGCLGSAGARKNLQSLIEAVLQLRQEGLAVGLLRAGSALPEHLQQLLSPLVAAGCFVDLGLLHDDHVGSFYGCLDVFAMPSLLEGFGLPVLEAMATGVPVICSNTTSLPEVGGDAVRYCDPQSPSSLAEQIRQLSSTGERQKLAARGLSRAAEFPWSRTFESCLGIYRQFNE
jgi:glycosyltransferase involved in cell wall biosynthesis